MRALITGITGQDGSYLAELLLGKGYEVYGLLRRQANPNLSNIERILPDVRLLSGDLADQGSLMDAVAASKPDEVYNLAAQSNVGTSYQQPVLTSDITGVGAVRLLETVRRQAPRARFYQAATSELYGACRRAPHELPTDTGCRFQPVSPYAFSKLLAFNAVRTYRDGYGIHASNGILFNHESPRRGVDFVTRKITWHVARRRAGHDVKLTLGRLDTIRDWGYAPEYVEAMWRLLQLDEPDDVVIGTGEATTVDGFLDYALEAAGLERDGWVSTELAQERPVETAPLVAETSTALVRLGWRAQTRAKYLARIMVEADTARLEETA